MTQTTAASYCRCRPQRLESSYHWLKITRLQSSDTSPQWHTNSPPSSYPAIPTPFGVYKWCFYINLSGCVCACVCVGAIVDMGVRINPAGVSPLFLPCGPQRLTSLAASFFSIPMPSPQPNKILESSWRTELLCLPLGCVRRHSKRLPATASWVTQPMKTQDQFGSCWGTRQCSMTERNSQSAPTVKPQIHWERGLLWT